MSKSQLTLVLLGLDSGNDEHWTAQGAPLLNVVSANFGSTVLREDVNAEIPTLTRSTIDAIRAEMDAFDESDNTDETLEGLGDTQPSTEDTKIPKNEAEGFTLAEEGVSDAKAELLLAKKKLDKAQALLDTFKEKRDLYIKRQKPAEMIIAFQESQRKAREAKVKSAQEFRDFLASRKG